MSGSMYANATGWTYRRQLLMTASAFALIAMTSTAEGSGNDTDNPPIWIEFSGGLDSLTDAHDLFTPSYMLATQRSDFETGSPRDLQRGPHMGWDADVKLTFQPEGTDWVLSAAARYGRVLRHQHEHSQPPPYAITPSYGYAIGPFAFYEATARNMEGHVIIDFHAGKDVGLGLFGARGSSVFSLGARYAHFDSRSDVQLSSHTTLSGYRANVFHGTSDIRHQFSGIGPSISWDAAAPFAGTVENGSLWLDWGANAAILFGKQSTRGTHETRAPHRVSYTGSTAVYGSNHSTVARRRSRSVTNLGGYAAISYRLESVKLSVGYKADMFIGAIDGGIDAAKKEDRAFFGPYASISIGLGG